MFHFEEGKMTSTARHSREKNNGTGPQDHIETENPIVNKSNPKDYHYCLDPPS